ncbi:hypothetical protein B0T22DRAFT_495937 [Podospora appendiculata]|uniref:FluG domain-containing protein n=1 Tax=Podospora appendiculata TaxID=314037 RepID=A0AAE0XGD8_9PEZI|nr:hypothetical protein B0T22DRAFT_495937 [Podospora appendiculata]
MAPSVSVRSLPFQRQHMDFIQRFTNQESETRIAKRPQALTAAQHTALREQLKEVRFLTPDYVDSTKINITGILRKWKGYCKSAKLEGDWRTVIKKADRAMAMDFLFHMCEAHSIKSWGTSWEYFRQFKQLYASTTGRYVDRNDSKVLKWHNAVLTSRFKLQAPNSGGKDVADSGDLLAIQAFNIAYDTSVFSWERHRIKLSGCYLGLAFTGARPAEFVDGEKKRPKDGSLEELFGPRSTRPSLDDKYGEGEAPDEDSRVLDEILSQETVGRGRPKCLCYEDILLMVVHHPETGKDTIVMSIKFLDSNDLPFRTVFFFTLTRRLIFCLITVIVSLVVHDRAFAAPSLTSVKNVFQTKNRGPVKCTPLRWKKEWLKRPIFRQSDDSAIAPGRNFSDEYKPPPYHKLRDDMARQSLDYGYERPIEPKAGCRGAANAANGNASDAVRDQMMRHDPKWATFNSAYINEKVQFHLQNAVLDEPAEDSLIGMLSHISLMRDPRARKDMVPEKVWADMPPDPEILALEEERALLKGGQYRITGTENEERRHANGEEEEEHTEPAVELHIQERAKLADILCNQPDNLDSPKSLEVRIHAGELMSALCEKRETAKRHRVGQTAPTGIVKTESPEPDVFPLLMQRSQCPHCIGDERLTYEERTFKYSRPTVMYDHFDREHAKPLKAG